MERLRAAVFVKQVPDLRAGSVATRRDGTIDRSSAPAITNPADLHALEAAAQLAGDVVAITMGPPAAEAAVRDALAHGATQGALVTDRAFAGSDTWATANVLAAAVRHLGQFDILLCGHTALDGETGQVGPQVAVRLSLPHATGCEDLAVQGDRLLARRVIEGGYETLSLPMPALVSITETGFAPRYPTWPRRQHAATSEMIRLAAPDLEVPRDMAGLEASPTKVAHMETVPMPSLDTAYVGADLTYRQLAALLRGLAEDEQSAAGAVGPVPMLPSIDPEEGATAVWVVCELVEGSLSAASAELLTKARDLSTELNGSVAAFIAGARLDRAIEDASTFGADDVLVAIDERLSPYRVLPHSRVLYEAIVADRPEVVLFAATSTGRDLAPRVAGMLATGLAADCTDLRVADWRRRGRAYERILHQVRPAMAGSVLATCVCPDARPQMATVRPGVFDSAPAPRRSRVSRVPVDLTPADLAVDVVGRTVAPRSVTLAEASVVVAGGAGCSAENWNLVDDLANALGGQVAASRGAVDAGLAPRARQVGQTGTTVKPHIYVACGISGALQHVVGMREADTVVAVNRDADAPIFRFAHYGIVAEVGDALPRLTAALEAGRSGRSGNSHN